MPEEREAESGQQVAEMLSGGAGRTGTTTAGTSEAPPASDRGQAPPAAPSEPKPRAGEGKPPPENDSEYLQQLRDENARRRTRERELEGRVQELEDERKTELERAQTKAQREETKRREAEQKLLRHEVAAEKGVPAKLLPLLTATEKADLERQADLILSESKGETKVPDFGAGVRDSTPAAEDPAIEHGRWLAKQLTGRG